MKLDIFDSYQRWIISAVMIAVAYVSYYGNIGQQALQQYQAALWNSSASASESNDVQITVLTPKFIADAELLEQELVVHLTNNSGSLQIIEIGITGTVEDVPNAFVVGSLKRTSEKNGASSYVKLDVPPHSSATEIFLVSTLNSGGIKSDKELSVLFTFFANNSPLTFTGGGSQQGKVYAKFNRMKAFQQTAIRALIFPPFSNGILVLVPIIIAWFADPIVKCLAAMCRSKYLSKKTSSQKEPLHCTQCGKEIKQCPLCHNPPEESDWMMDLGRLLKALTHVVIAFFLMALTYISIDTGLLKGNVGLSLLCLTPLVVLASLVYVLEDMHSKEIA